MRTKKIAVAVMLSMLLVACSCHTQQTMLVNPLEDSAWEQSSWISAKDATVAHGRVHEDLFRAADGASWFFCRFSAEKSIKRALWMTTALGVYDIYVNGELVGEEVLKPGFTHPQKTRTSFTYDVTALVRSGENILSAQVTPGWWADKIVSPKHREGFVGEKCAFRAVLELEYSDGSRELLGTDTENWLSGIGGPVLHAAIFDGEEYDARIDVPHLDSPSLSKPELNSEFEGEIVPVCGAQVYHRTDLALPPQRAYVWQGVDNQKQDEHGKVIILREYSAGEEIVLEPGETLVVDFGQNAAAVPQFCFKAECGTRLECLPSEILNDGNGAESRGMDGPEGSVHRRNLRLHEQLIRLGYTFRGKKGWEAFTPRCTFFGYRYISVTVSARTLFRSIVSVPVSSITSQMESGVITTGDESINRLISNTLWGQRSNYLSVPTDCPQRDERLGWTADTQVFTQTGAFFADTDAFFHKWMRDMRDTQSATGAYPGVAPQAQYGWFHDRECMRLGWADAGVIVPWTIWRQYDDREIIDENWESMERFMDHVNCTQYRHELLTAENGNYQWADWLSYEPLESCSRQCQQWLGGDRWEAKPEAVHYWNYLSGCYWALDAGMMKDMALATGRDGEKYEKMELEARDYLKREFFTADGRFRLDVLNSMQTPALFALRLRLVEGEQKERMKQALRSNFESHDGCLQTGFLGTSILMSTLSQNGMDDVAYSLLFQRGNPSWLYSVDNGATTIWERWNSYTLEGGMGPKGMNSFNHYAYGCVCQWLWESAAGIMADTAEPGFRHIVMRPVPDRRLSPLRACYRSRQGEIRSEWRYEGERWIWNFTVPHLSRATVTLPFSGESKEYEAGSYTVELDCSGF